MIISNISKDSLDTAQLFSLLGSGPESDSEVIFKAYLLSLEVGADCQRGFNWFSLW